VVLVHNHPSGDPDPSVQDVATTRRLTQAGKLLGIDVMDHVIIGDGTWASLKQLELME
jgi:DNA repair protein RadC